MNYGYTLIYRFSIGQALYLVISSLIIIVQALTTHMYVNIDNNLCLQQRAVQALTTHMYVNIDNIPSTKSRGKGRESTDIHL